LCAECNLAIELDGAMHSDPMRKEYDADRTAFLEREGVRVIRFENKCVFESMDGVLETIREAIRSRVES
jgi:very-short-patch-repair endonuclease